MRLAGLRVGVAAVLSIAAIAGCGSSERIPHEVAIYIRAAEKRLALAAQSHSPYPAGAVGEGLEIAEGYESGASFTNYAGEETTRSTWAAIAWSLRKSSAIISSPPQNRLSNSPAPGRRRAIRPAP